MTLLEPYNLPFAIALAALFAVGLMQLVGAGDFFYGAGDVEIDMDADVADGVEASGFMDGLMTLLGLGKVPFLIWLSTLLFVFALIGVVGQALINGATGSPLPAGLAALLATGAAVPLNGLLVRPIGKLFPI